MFDVTSIINRIVVSSFIVIHPMGGLSRSSRPDMAPPRGSVGGDDSGRVVEATAGGSVDVDGDGRDRRAAGGSLRDSGAARLGRGGVGLPATIVRDDFSILGDRGWSVTTSCWPSPPPPTLVDGSSVLRRGGSLGRAGRAGRRAAPARRRRRDGREMKE